ncbi:hypothetical protein, partial [Arthrobacter sp. Cr_A7]|uniref:hypothetical protein n=1 Tax=Arthrobacter sp. Cr_A7 TaxID=3031017 RepID=UPI0023DCB124
LSRPEALASGLLWFSGHGEGLLDGIENLTPEPTEVSDPPGDACTLPGGSQRLGGNKAPPLAS